MALASASDINRYFFRDIEEGIELIEHSSNSDVNFRALAALLAALCAVRYTDWSYVIPDIEAAMTKPPQFLREGPFEESSIPSHYHARYKAASHLINSLINAGLEDEDELKDLSVMVVNIIAKINMKNLSNDSRRIVKAVYKHLLTVASIIFLSEFDKTPGLLRPKQNQIIQVFEQ